MIIFKKTGILFFVLFFVYLFFPQHILAQYNHKDLQPEIVELYNFAEDKYPTNDEFVNGCIYPLPNSKILGDPYFGNNEWHEGILFINGKEYPKIMLKYDITINELIIKAKVKENIERLITINKSQIDSFRIGTSLFINSRKLFPNDEINTYYEQVYPGKLSVYRQYQKNFIDMFSSSSPEGKFSSQKVDTYLYSDQNLTSINKFTSFLAYFEKPDRDKIKKYLKSNNINYKKMTDLQIIGLMEFCNSNISH
jgi:hypothetical protein